MVPGPPGGVVWKYRPAQRHFAVPRRRRPETVTRAAVRGLECGRWRRVRLSPNRAQHVGHLFRPAKTNTGFFCEGPTEILNPGIFKTGGGRRREIRGLLPSIGGRPGLQHMCIVAPIGERFFSIDIPFAFKGRPWDQSASRWRKFGRPLGPPASEGRLSTFRQSAAKQPAPGKPTTYQSRSHVGLCSRFFYKFGSPMIRTSTRGLSS